MEQPAETCLLLLSGLPAAGKTSLARSLAREASDDGIEVRHVCFDELGCQPTSGGSGSDGAGEAAEAFSPEAWQVARRAALAQLELDLASSSSGGGSSASTCSSDSEARQQQQQPLPADDVQHGVASGSSASPDAAEQHQGPSWQQQQRRLVIADDNLQYRSMRWQCYGLARAAGAAVVLLHLRCSEQLAQARNAQRPAAERVPPAVISRMAAQSEVPGSSGSSSGSGSACDGGSGSSNSIAAWERSCLVECSAEQPIDAAAVWQQVRRKWGGPAPPPFDAQAAAAERAAAQAATAASRAHAIDVATRQVMSQAMQRLAHAAPAARGAAAQQLNAKRRQLLQEAAAEQQAAAPEEPSIAAERWAAAFQQHCDAMRASLN